MNELSNEHISYSRGEVLNMTTERKASWKSLLAYEAITLGAGGAVAFLTRSSMDFYNTLNKPVFAPPGIVFPIAWSLLYAAMAYAAWRIHRRQKPRRKAALALYWIQLVVNLAWPILFFVMHALGLSFLWLILLWALVMLLMIVAFEQDRTAGWLLVPYAAWITFAGVLNFAVAQLNP